MKHDKLLATMYLVYIALLIFTVNPSAMEVSIEAERTAKNIVKISSIEITPPQRSLGMFTLTAYCPCEKCCGKWGANRPKDSNGNAIVYTASGRPAKSKRTVAVDPGLIPLGSEITIDGQTYSADDTGGSVKGKRIDVYFSDHQEAVGFGKKCREVFIVSKG